MMKELMKLTGIIFILLIPCIAMAQNNKDKIIDYLIKIKSLKPNLKEEDYKGMTFIVDLVTHQEADNNESGIFKFGTFSAHDKSFILLKDKHVFEILSLEKLDEDLIKEIEFMDNHNYSSDNALKCIKNTIKVYQRNLIAIPWTAPIINKQ